MNILEQEDIIKGLPDQALQEEAKAPSGQVPQFLVVSEIQRRTDMRKKYQDPNEQKPQGTVADQITQEGIASVQPQQPMQGEQQQGQPMPMRGGGMTPFMRKYAGGGVVRMQEGGITPNEMLQLDSQMMAQKYPFLSGSRDEILQGLSGIDPNDAGYISSMFGGAPEIESVLEQVSNRNNLMSQDLSRGLSPAPMVENITEPSLLTLDGVNTLTPDGQRPYPPNTPSVDTLEKFSNAITEDAARRNNLLATLDDSTAIQKEAISNPVNVDLPKKVNADEDYFSGLGFDQEKDTSIEGILAESQNALRGMSPQDRAENMLSNIPSGYSSRYEGEDNHQAKMRARTRAKESKSKVNNLLATLGDLTPVEEFANSASGIGNVNPNNRGGFGRVLGDIRDSVVDSPFGNILSNSVGIDGSSDSDSSNASSSEPVGTGTVLRQPVGTNTVLRKDNGMYLPQLANPDLFSNLEREVTPEVTLNETVISDGAGTQGSGDPIAKGSNKAVSLLDRALGLNLDGAKKEAYAMAMIQLGAGIAKGDLAEGLSNAGVAASGVLDKARDRSGKQLDRDLQSQYYADKLESSSEEKRQALTLKVETAYMNWLNEGGNLKTDAEKATYKSDLYKAVFGEEAQGDDDQSGQRGKVATISYDKDGNRI